MSQWSPQTNAIFEAAQSLHWNYGKGNIRTVRLWMDGRIEVVAQITSGQTHSAWGRIINGRTVKMYRHQVTVKDAK